MSLSIQFVTNVAGYGSADGRSFPKVIGESSRVCRSHNKIISGAEFAPLKVSSRRNFLVCNAGTGGYRRNPESSKQNRFSRSRNRPNEERVGSDSFEDPEVYSKNGPMLSMSGASRFQATATPGPREREIVELFRKVQAQLRERAAVKEEKKREESPGQGKESETVDSLLKLLRKHTTQQGKKTSSKDSILDQSKQNGAYNGEKSTIYSDFVENRKDEGQEIESSSFTRPPSNFRRRSPVPRVKFQPFDSDSFVDTYIRPRKEVNEDEEPEIESEPKLAIEPVLSEFDEISDDDDLASDDEEDYSDDDEDEDEEGEEEEEQERAISAMDYNAMKVTELRELAKSRGVKGFSKLKKADLVELLSGGSL